jgi:prepilin-type N-terminal cleavage/methylation domain-containing protein
MKNKSFTLIELLVVIVIIGILAGVIMISTSSSIDKANIAKLKIFEESIQNSLAVDTVSRWRLDGDAKDIWGNNHGTTIDVTFLNNSQCVTGECASFNGSSSYIDCGNNSILSANETTLTAWIKINALSDAHMRIFASKSTNKYPFTVGVSSGKLAFSDQNNVGSACTADALDLDKWFFISVMSNGSQSSAILYVNGKEQGKAGGGGFTFSTKNVIGSYFSGTSASHFL